MSDTEARLSARAKIRIWLWVIVAANVCFAALNVRYFLAGDANSPGLNLLVAIIGILITARLIFNRWRELV